MQSPPIRPVQLVLVLALDQAINGQQETSRMHAILMTYHCLDPFGQALLWQQTLCICSAYSGVPQWKKALSLDLLPREHGYKKISPRP